MKRTDEMVYKASLFKGVAAEDFPAMLETLDSQLKYYRSGQIVLKEGTAVHALGILLEGRLIISTVSWWGKKCPLEDIRPGQVFAEDLAQTRGAVSDLRIEAEVPSTVLWVEVREIFALDGSAKWHTIVIRNLMNAFARRNLILARRERCLTRRNTRGKILSYLSDEAFRQQSTSFDIPYNRQQLADYLSVDRSAMSQQLSLLAKEGWFTTSHEHFELHRIPQPEKK